MRNNVFACLSNITPPKNLIFSAQKFHESNQNFIIFSRVSIEKENNYVNRKWLQCASEWVCIKIKMSKSVVKWEKNVEKWKNQSPRKDNNCRNIQPEMNLFGVDLLFSVSLCFLGWSDRITAGRISGEQTFNFCSRFQFFSDNHFLDIEVIASD